MFCRYESGSFTHPRRNRNKKSTNAAQSIGIGSKARVEEMLNQETAKSGRWREVLWGSGEGRYNTEAYIVSAFIPT